jgi:DNA-binding protein HU-beta
MTKEELAKGISDKTGIEKLQVIKTIDAFMQTVRASMIKGQNVYLRGFGTFEVVKRAKKTARNISKNTAIIIPEHFIPKFKPAKEFTKKVKAEKH